VNKAFLISVVWADEKQKLNFLAFLIQKLDKNSITQEFLLPNVVLLFVNVPRAQ